MPFAISQYRSIYGCSAITVLIVMALAFTLHRSVPQKIRRPAGSNEDHSTVSGPRTPTLTVESITPYGHIVEIIAETDPGTTVMVNGERAAVIFAGSRIRHFVGPLPDGVTVLTITAQNDEGGVITKRLAVVLP